MNLLEQNKSINMVMVDYNDSQIVDAWSFWFFSRQCIYIFFLDQAVNTS